VMLNPTMLCTSPSVHIYPWQTTAVASSICEDGLPLDVWQTVTPDWLLLFCSVLVGCGRCSLLNRYD